MRLLASRRSWLSPTLLRNRFLLACVLVLFSSITASAQVRFIQITDPHFYDGQDAAANKRAFLECIAKINKLIDEGGNYKFIVVTGDIGLEKLVEEFVDKIRELEKLPDSADNREQINTLNRTINLKVSDSASEVANMIGQSRMKVWLFLPGNNDLIDEQICLDGMPPCPNEKPPGKTRDGLTYYRSFVEQLGDRLRGKTIVDLCPTDDPKKGVYTDIDGLVFVGFNNASFKNNNEAKRISRDTTKTASVVARTDSQRCEADSKIQTGAGSIPTAELPETEGTVEQLKYVQQVIDRVAETKSYAYVLYHIPDADDPYAVLDSGSTSLAGRSLSQSDQYFFSSWFVDGCVRERWTKVVMNPKVRGLFAGHFHDWRRETYQDYRWNNTPNYLGGSLSKQYVSPPLAVKRQNGQPSQARGFQEVSIDGTGRVSANIFWYDADSGAFESVSEKQRAPASVSSWRLLGSVVSYVWGTVPSYLPFYLIVVVCVYAAYKGRKRVTVIAPFHLPAGNNLPFGGYTVANAMHDAFATIMKTVEPIGTSADTRLKLGQSGPASQGGTGPFRQSASNFLLEGIDLPKLPPFETSNPYTAEVKGLSHDSLVSLARKVLYRERIISGDVVGNKSGFSLFARCGGIGYWTCGPFPATTQGLNQACDQLALKVLETMDPFRLAVYEIANKNFEGAYERLRKLMKDA